MASARAKGDLAQQAANKAYRDAEKARQTSTVYANEPNQHGNISLPSSISFPLLDVFNWQSLQKLDTVCVRKFSNCLGKSML